MSLYVLFQIGGADPGVIDAFRTRKAAEKARQQLARGALWEWMDANPGLTKDHYAQDDLTADYFVESMEELILDKWNRETFNDLGDAEDVIDRIYRSLREEEKRRPYVPLD